MSDLESTVSADDGTNQTKDAAADVGVSENHQTEDGVAAENLCENLTQLKLREKELSEEAISAKQLIDRYENELSRERVYRKEMEDNYRRIAGETDKKILRFQADFENIENKLLAMQDKHTLCYQKMVREYTRAAETCQRLENDFLLMKKRYENLLGINKLKAEQMRDQVINLPQTVDELEVLCLKLTDDLIEERSAREHESAEKEGELTAAREQLRELQTEKVQGESLLTNEIDKLRVELRVMHNDLSIVRSKYDQLNDVQKSQQGFQQRVQELEKHCSEVEHHKILLERSLAEYKQKCTALQKELDTSETVQKDFVCLSQNLQIELEKIRQAENEVRWQFPEDVHACNGCETKFGPKTSKHNCRHCGKIFCPNCLTRTIPTGPNRHLAKVCSVCHTLLNRESAPFFSNAGGDN